MRKVLLLSAVSLSLFVATPAHTAGEVPTVDYPPGTESCAATSSQLVFKAPAAAAVEGRVFEEGIGTITPFAVPAGATKLISVAHGGPLCTSTHLPNRKFRVATNGAPPFQVEVAADFVTLSAAGAVSDPVAGVTTAQLTLTCATGAVSGQAEIKTGTGAPDPLVVLHVADAVVGKSAHKGPLVNKTFSTPLKVKPITAACSSAHTFSVGIESPASSKTLTPSTVRFKKVP